MSGQWEVVGKRKDKGNKILDQKSTKETNKKKAENLNVRVEEVLAKSQVKSLYSSDKNKENKPLEKKSSEVIGNKKPQKKEKSQDLPKPKAPKSLESALNNIDVDEFKEIFEKTKLHFPDASIVWLKELSQFLNQKLSNVEVRDPVFGQAPKYPINIVPSGLKTVIEKATMDLDKSNRQLFFDISLTSMATDMSKNLPAMGHKLFLQHIALSDPNLVVENLTKHSVLRNSYQNRPNIGLSILWAVGQAGVCNFQAGFKVFQELMLPLIEMKSYSRFIFQYLSDLLTYFKNKIRLTKEQHQLILEAVFFSKKNFPSEFRDLFLILIPTVRDSIFDKREETLSSFVDFYFTKIATCSDNSYQDCVCDVITECFSRDQTSLENWPKFYNKNLTSSAILLRYIEKNWRTISHKLNRKSLLQALNEITLVNDKLLLKKRKEDSLNDAVNTVKNLLDKMAHTKKTRSPFKFLFFTFFILIAGFVYFDIKQQGDWQKSNTRKFLENSGICEYSHKALHQVKRGVWWVDDRIEENFPGYHKKVIEVSEPYVELSRNLGRIFYNIAMNVKEVMSEKFPVVVQSIESYAPGLVEHSQNAVSNVWSSSVFYVNRSLDYLRKEVFVGQLSPENMQRVVFEALNTTQIKAAEYYHWLYEKVQTTIK